MNITLDYSSLSDFLLRAMNGDARARHELEQRQKRMLQDTKIVRLLKGCATRRHKVEGIVS